MVITIYTTPPYILLPIENTAGYRIVVYPCKMAGNAQNNNGKCNYNAKHNVFEM